MDDIINANENENKKVRSRPRLERLKLDEVWEIITDKRFSIRFKIANLICRDYLRNYLASVNHRIQSSIDILDNEHYTDETKIRHIKRNLERARNTLDEVFDL